MPLDPRLALMAGQGVPPIDPLAFPRGQQLGLQLQSAQRQGQLGQMELADAQRQEQERGTMARAFQKNVVTDPVTGETRVNIPGAFTEAYRTTSDPLTVFKAQQGYEKQQAASAKDTLEARKTEIETHLKGLEFVGQIASGIQEQVAAGGDPQQAWQQGIQAVAQAGYPIQGVPPTYDASYLAKLKATGLAQKDALQAQQKVVDQQLEERRLALGERTEQRQERAEGRAATKAQREEREAAGGLYPYATDSTLNAAINRAMQDAGLPRGSQPTPEVLQRADELVVSGGVRKAAATGREAAEIARTEQPLDAATQKAVADISALQAMTDDVTDLFDPSYTGALEGRWGAVKQWRGTASQREVVFRRVVEEMKSQLLSARSGAAVTPQEYERLLAIVPNVTDSDETFQAKLLGFRRGLDQAKAAKLEAATTGRGPLRTQQPAVTPLPGGGAGAKTGSPAAPAAGRGLTEADIEATIKDSVTAGRPVTRQQVIEAAKRKGWQTP